jgi:hypothetical protein
MFTPVGTAANVADITGANPQSAIATQAWLIQAENYVIWNDGINLPVFYNGTTTTRSLGFTNPNPLFTVLTGVILTVPFDTQAITLTAPWPGAAGDKIVLNPGNTAALTGTVTIVAGATITVQWDNAGPFGIFAGNQLQLQSVPQFPVGRQMAYGRGRIWMALADGQQFMAGDIVGGPSGTKALNFRDAILNITENQFLVGGGTFRIPGSIGAITAMIFTAQIDVALGQGPLMVFTATQVFSCNAPVDRLTWQSLTNPILTVAAIGNGAMGQYSTFLVNSDTQYRSPDGIRSLILSSLDFNTWIRTPISNEVERVLNRDNAALLAFGSGVFFDNRTLMTASPISTTQGVYHQALVVLNTDLLTTVREKKPPAYDGVWPGMNILGITTGLFSLVQRCYAFTYNTVLQNMELWEILPSSASDVDNNPNPVIDDNGRAIEWWFESPSLFRDRTNAERVFKRLVNGEIFIDQLVGRVDFQAFFRPDEWPCWVPWLAWSECAQQTTGNDNVKPGFRPRMGMGTPTQSNCEAFTNRPFPEFYTMQFKLVVVGQCRFLGARFKCVVIPEQEFAAPNCSSVC